MTNSFLQLRSLEIAEFEEERLDRVRAKVEKRLRTSEFVGSVLELFFPKLADTITVMMGGEAIEGQEDYSTIEDKYPLIKPDQPRLPGGGERDEIIR